MQDSSPLGPGLDTPALNDPCEWERERPWDGLGTWPFAHWQLEITSSSILYNPEKKKQLRKMDGWIDLTLLYQIKQSGVNSLPQTYIYENIPLLLLKPNNRWRQSVMSQQFVFFSGKPQICGHGSYVYPGYACLVILVWSTFTLVAPNKCQQ